MLMEMQGVSVVRGQVDGLANRFAGGVGVGLQANGL